MFDVEGLSAPVACTLLHQIIVIVDFVMNNSLQYFA